MAAPVVKLTSVRDWVIIVQCDLISLNQKLPIKEVREAVLKVCEDDTKAPVMLVMSIANHPETGKQRSAALMLLVRKTKSIIPVTLIPVPDEVKMITLDQLIHGTMKDLRKIQDAVKIDGDDDSDEEIDDPFEDDDDDFMNRKPKKG